MGHWPPLWGRHIVKRWFCRTGWCLGALVAALVLWLGWLHASGNFHPVIDGEVYRSAQMSPADLSRWQAEYGIRSVLNLRGENADAPWYRDEIEAARALGLTHADFRMSARRSIDSAEAAHLVRLMRDLPKPLLIHCASGADRTGLASALYVAALAKGGEEAAEWQLSPRYGHLGIPVLSQAWPMDQSWEVLEPWLGYSDS